VAKLSPSMIGRSTLALALLAGLAVRFRFLADTLGANRIFLFGADPYYHVRRARLIAERFPDLVYTDPFQNFPHCAPCSSLPAGFDLLLAGLSTIMPAPTLADRVALAGVFVVPLLGLLTVFLVWHFSARLLDRTGQILAVFGAALLPAFVDNSFAGRPDHHVLDPLTTLALLAALAAAVRQNKAHERWQIPAIAAGLVGGMALVSFPSALVTVTLSLGAGALASLVLLLRRIDPRPVASATAIAGLLAGGISWLFMGLFTPCFLSTTLISNTLFPGLLAGLIGGFCLTLVVLCHWRSQWRERIALALALLLLALGIAGAAVALSDGLQRALGNWLYVMAGQVIPELSPEWRPLWRTPAHWFNGKFTWAFLLVPVGLGLLARSAWRDPRRPERLLVMALAALLVPLAIVQAKYFVHLYAPVALLAMAAALGQGAQWAWQRFFARGSLRRLAAPVVTVLVLGGLALEPASHYRAVELIHWQTADLFGLLEWVREQTPNPDPHRPEYGIMNTWETGFWVAEVADRPVYANNFVAAPPTTVYIRHLASAYRWLLDSTAAPLLQAMQDNQTPFLLLIPVDGGKLFGYYQLIGEDPGEVVIRDPDSGQWVVGPGFLDTTFAQLYAHHGSALPHRPCIAGLQLVRTSAGSMPLGGHNLPVAQFYRRVSGALLSGRAKPHEAVRVGVLLATSAGTTVPFECTTTASQNGEWQLRFPYPSTAPEGIAYQSPVLVVTGAPGPDNPPRAVQISAAAVDSGARIEIPQ
jgi:asparagine N-glycosylation enzyme membrane subunit Stt3